MKLYLSLCTVVLVLATQFSVAQQKTNPKSQPEELGTVSWYRNYNEAITQAAKANKSVLILFQEIPGCATCRNYGEEVLSDPLLTEMIQNEFIPLAIYNNKSGPDKEILKKFNEPAWNNPVVRIVDSNGKDIVSRVNGNYTALGLHKAMIRALQITKKKIPGYASLLGEELTADKLTGTKVAYYSMYCFWTGEKELGSVTGVLNTEAGFMKGHEVVKVEYDPIVTPIQALDAFAKQNKFTPLKADNSYRSAQSDEDYYLQHSKFKYLPLSLLQRTKINSALGRGIDPMQFLSPKQVAWYKEAQGSKENALVSNKPFKSAWLQKS